MFPSIGVSRLRMGTDGDGVTTLVAAHGCSLRCAYCLNPQCFQVRKPRRVYTVQNLLNEVKIDDLYFQATGGGIVFGGGEPLLRADFIHAFCQKAPKEWKILAETSLALPAELLSKVLGDIDTWIVDIKDMNPEIYKAYTGKSNEDTLRNLKVLIGHVGPERVLIRLPLIPDYNTEEDRGRSLAILREMGFTRFDPFTYDREHPGKKKARILERIQKNTKTTG